MPRGEIQITFTSDPTPGTRQAKKRGREQYCGPLIMPHMRVPGFTTLLLLSLVNAGQVTSSNQLEPAGSRGAVVKTLFRNLGLCAALESFDLEVCRDRSKKIRDVTSSGGAFQPIVDQPGSNDSRSEVQWSFNKFVIKGIPPTHHASFGLSCLLRRRLLKR